VELGSRFYQHPNSIREETILNDVPDRNLALELVWVTEAAALAACGLIAMGGEIHKNCI